MDKFKNSLLVAALFLSVCAPLPVLAADALYGADAAVADILFEYDGSESFASYAVSEDGFVDITFARNIPDELYGEILQRLKDDQHIAGVLAGKSGPVCAFSR